jgi:hypothetical protein
MIYWLLPIKPNGRLRLVLTDCAVAEVDIAVEADPYPVDYAEEWRGELALIGAEGSRVLELVSVKMTTSPAEYHVQVLVRDAGTVKTTSYALTHVA